MRNQFFTQTTQKWAAKKKKKKKERWQIWRLASVCPGRSIRTCSKWCRYPSIKRKPDYTWCGAMTRFQDNQKGSTGGSEHLNPWLWTSLGRKDTVVPNVKPLTGTCRRVIGTWREDPDQPITRDIGENNRGGERVVLFRVPASLTVTYVFTP